MVPPAPETRIAGVIPALNEAHNIRHAVTCMAAARHIDEVFVVDGRSADGTAEVAETAGATVFQERRSAHPGKGTAIETAVANLDHDLLVFFDADLHNMRPGMVDRLVIPVRDGRADHSVATYKRAGGRVTELTVRPLLELFFPEVTLRQPLAGEFCTRREVLASLPLEPDWGIESGLVIDLTMQGFRVQEVDLGFKDHDMKELDELAPMARQAARTIIDRAGYYGRLGRPQKEQALAPVPV